MTSPTAFDRTLAAFRALVRLVSPQLLYFGRYRYSVHSATATAFDGIPVDISVAPALPVGVPYAQALAGSSCIPAVGSIAHVMFADGDPGQPVCVGFEIPVVNLPSEITINASGAVNLGDGFARLVREGDVYTLGTATGPLTFVSTVDPNGPTKGKA